MSKEAVHADGSFPALKPGAGAYIVSRGAAGLGTSAAEVLLPLVVLTQLNGTTTVLAAIQATAVIVGLILRLPIAAILDRSTANVRIQKVCLALSAALSLGIVVLQWQALLSLSGFAIIIIANSVVQMIVAVSGFGLVNDLADGDGRVVLTGRLTSTANASSLVGQGATPLLTKVLAPAFGFIVNAFFSVVALFALTPVRPAPVAEAAAEHPGEETKEKFAIVRRLLKSPIVLTIFLVGIFDGLSAPVGVAYILTVLDIPSWLLGVVMVCGAVGGIVGGIAVGKVISRLSLTRICQICAFGTAAGYAILIAAAAVPSPWTIPVVAVAEFTQAIFGTILMSVAMGTLQRDTDRHLIGRTMSTVLIGLEILGSAGMGIAALTVAAAGEVTLLAISGVGWAVIGGSWFLIPRRSQQDR